MPSHVAHSEAETAFCPHANERAPPTPFPPCGKPTCSGTSMKCAGEGDGRNERARAHPCLQLPCPRRCASAPAWILCISPSCVWACRRCLNEHVYCRKQAAMHSAPLLQLIVYNTVMLHSSRASPHCARRRHLTSAAWMRSYRTSQRQSWSSLSRCSAAPAGNPATGSLFIARMPTTSSVPLSTPVAASASSAGEPLDPRKQRAKSDAHGVYGGHAVLSPKRHL